MDIDPDKLANLTKVSKKLKKNTSDHRIKKTNDLPKDGFVKLNSENNIKGSKEENEISTKRKSYRQKVKDFKTNKSKSGDSAKIPKNKNNLEVINKQGNQEKRQGWWNQ